jgi:hypothetical protein
MARFEFLCRICPIGIASKGGLRRSSPALRPFFLATRQCDRRPGTGNTWHCTVPKAPEAGFAEGSAAEL